MASNRPAPEFSSSKDPSNDAFGPRSETWEEWNPTEDSVRPVRGRHRVARQRGGLARSSTVLGVGVIAAVGAGGIATAQGGKPAVHLSLPDLSSVKDSLPEAASLPGVGALISGGSAQSGDSGGSGGSGGSDTAATPLTTVGNGTSDAGEALRTRILAQAETQQDAADAAAQRAAEEAAAQQAADEAAAKQEAADKKQAAEKKKAAEEARKRAEAERLAELAKSYKLPVASYTLTGTFGQPGAMWSSGYHTGLDFAAPTGTPIHAVHSGTVTEAGWAGAYGYRTIITLDDGTELWFCHQSSLNVSAGQKVSTGDVIGRVGATGNVTGPHLHLEVHPGGDATGIDPAAWLRERGLTP
ncbi:M23 family metallopeptidase [Streptomyces sp. NPDC088785]|uniref:M23 family metallopeptidase n=1 Tax=Streptomyces sp. NPDC088785 TaxID=3365897 RepID=UPI003813EDF4